MSGRLTLHAGFAIGLLGLIMALTACNQSSPNPGNAQHSLSDVQTELKESVIKDLRESKFSTATKSGLCDKISEKLN